VDGIEKIEKQAQDGICPLCKENRDNTVELDEVKVTKDGRTRVRASCPECSFKTWRNHDP
jgi:hypothetical protein